ncbi:MAG: substrate-binding domain-containing protein [Planctomycetes bacterium]|nr:substrate-binding domain-containing protein [Planctomycetota bacterium]
MKNVLIVVVFVVIAAIFIGIGISRKGSGGDQITIAVIPKGTTHIYWQSVKAGAEAAGKENNVKILWSGPELETDRERQIQIIEDFMVQNVDGIVLAPLDSKALVPSVEKITNSGIPCVIVDSGVDTENYVCFAATDNYMGGALAARRMGKILDGKGNIIVVKYQPGSDSTTKRENGFIDTIEKEFPGITIVDAQYGQGTVEMAIQATEDMLTKNKDIDGLYACNASTAVGAMQAIDSQQLSGKIKMVGFDAEDALIKGLQGGTIDALVVQDPFRMGHLGVTTILDKLAGKPVTKHVDTGVVLVTLENIQEPKIRNLLNLQ